MKYYVYFDQINQTRWKVVAKSKEEAIKKAARLWKEEYGKPQGAFVEVDKSQ